MAVRALHLVPLRPRREEVAGTLSVVESHSPDPKQVTVIEESK